MPDADNVTVIVAGLHFEPPHDAAHAVHPAATASNASAEAPTGTKAEGVHATELVTEALAALRTATPATEDVIVVVPSAQAT